MKKFLLRTGLFLLPLLAGWAWMVFRPLDMHRAYHYLQEDCSGRGPWIYRRMVESSEPVDIAFLGSSHTINGIDDGTIQSELKRINGIDAHVVNLGYCRLGRNLTWVMFQHLLRYKSPSCVFIEIMPDENGPGHPIFPFLAEGHDLLLPLSPIHRSYPEDVYNGTMARLRYAQQNIYDEPFVYNYGLGGEHGFAPVDKQADTTELREKKNKLLTQRDNRHNWYRPLAMHFPKAYLHAIGKACRDKNIRLVFLYLPPYGVTDTRPIEYDFYASLGEVWIPPDSLFAPPSYWYDSDHLNTQGAAAVSKWIAAEIAATEK